MANHVDVEIQDRQTQVPLCDLGFGPLSCFVTMKPFSCDYLTPIKTPSRPHSVQNPPPDEWRGAPIWEETETKTDPPSFVPTTKPKAANTAANSAHPGAANSALGSPKLLTTDVTSMQSFSSGGSSPTRRPKRTSPKAKTMSLPKPAQVLSTSRYSTSAAEGVSRRF